MKIPPAISILILLLLLACQNITPPEETAASATSEPFMLNKKGVLCAEVASDLDWYLQNSPAPILEGLDIIDYLFHPAA